MSRLTTGIAWRLAIVAAVLGTIACDRVTKHVAVTTLAGMPGRSMMADTVRLGYVENAGGFLGLGATLPPDIRTALFTVATGVMLAALAVLAMRRRWDRWPALGLALFLAGSSSNWIDRAVRGTVVDFLNVGIGSLRTGVFNVADVAIMLGAAILIIEVLRESRDSLPSPGG